ncbi:breast cancer type 2 susceptibility protein [Mugil cephalus]|uniref:breast cancer type 2 susceptibility protein n=1 Tax=Mugil cephalus TaxID=48193 RepID=UPI001FB85FBC|nr:breast cancer type 2 susceptibility protein [Mugil cephalus]
MDSASKQMYDAFKDDILKELGPLDPNWFEVLTAQANEENVSDQDELCANQEGYFTRHLDKTAVDSQLFSTPKVFRCRRIVSDETDDEHSFTAEQEKGPLPWAATSPNLFHTSKQRVPVDTFNGIQPQDTFGLIHTPHKSTISYANRISESLGAQINPDYSWTSSLNTPPESSTLILSKNEESSCPETVAGDKDVVLAWKLFPSLSKTSTVGNELAKNSDMPSVCEGAASPEASLKKTDGIWRQKLPDAIEDEEIRTTVASVLDGAENALSLFFANSSSSLRKVKLDRAKRKQITQTNVNGCGSPDISTTNHTSEERTHHQEPGSIPSSPLVKTGDTGLSQWSPLTLSQMPPSVDGDILTQRLKNSDSGQSVRPLIKVTDSGVITKKRKFVYTVGTLQPSHKMDSSPGIPNSGQDVSVKQLGKGPDEAVYCPVGNTAIQVNLPGENLHSSVQAKIQDLDISQLGRDFAQDFSQMAEPCKQSKAAEDTQRDHFCPSTCLSAMKQAKQKAMQATLRYDSDGIRKPVFTTNQNFSINDGATGDSGFQSGVADNTHMSASSFVLPCSEDIGQSQPSFPSAKKEKRKVHFGAESKTTISSGQSSRLEKRETLGSGGESELHLEGTSAQLPTSSEGSVDNINCIPLNGQVCGSLPEKAAVSLPSLHTSGFKTASNKGIQISSANLERAKNLFEETEGERTFTDHQIKSDRAAEHTNKTSNASVKSTTSNSNQQLPLTETFGDNTCQLTASQMADVTELCTLLEEADSQFEFTQFKTEKPKKHSQDDAATPQNTDKELDPDFLKGIDFDDSFNSDAEKHMAKTVMPDQMTSVLIDKRNSRGADASSKATGMSMSSTVTKENSSVGEATSSSEHITEGSLMSTEPQSLDKTEHTETNKLENPLMRAVAFKTAGGNALRVSKACLSKARALFADLEENLTDQKSTDQQIDENGAKIKHKKSIQPAAECMNGGIKFEHAGQVSHHSKKPPVDDVKMNGIGYNGAPALKNEPSPHGNQFSSSKQFSSMLCNTSKNIDSSSVSSLSSGNGFCTASGKKVSVSADAIKKAESLLNEVHILEDTNKQLSQKALRTEQLSVNICAPPPKCSGLHIARGKGVGFSSAPLKKTPVQHPPSSNVGFLSASGKKVALSSDALQKAKTLFSDISLSDAMPHLSHPSVKYNDKKQDKAEDAKKINSSITTAGGENVHMPRKSLCKTKHLLKGFDESVSTEAMQEGDALFKACDMDMNDGLMSKNGNKSVNFSKLKPDQSFTVSGPENTGNGSTLDTSSKQVKQTEDTLPPQKDGFQTASGKGVVISSEALKKAKTLFSECERAEGEFHITASHSKTHIHGPPPRKGGFLAASGKPMTLSSEALLKANAIFSDISLTEEIPAVLHTRNGDEKQNNTEDTDKIHCGFTTAGGANVHVSQKNVLKAKHLLKECDDSISTKAMQETDAFFKDCDVDGSNGPMSRSDNKKKSFLNLKPNEKDSVNISVEPGHKCTDNPSKEEKQREDTLPPQKGGFQTASGKGVVISSEALKKAKSLLSECNEVGGESSVQPSLLKASVHAPLARNGGFLSASGKKVTLSSEALQKAKSLFGDISLGAEMSDVSHTRHGDKKKDNGENTEKMHCDLTTAEREKVHVSPRNLSKANSLLKELDNSVSTEMMQEADAFFKGCDMDIDKRQISASVGEKKPDISMREITSEEAGNDCTAQDTSKQGKQREDTLPPQRSGFQTASGKGVAISSEALKKAKSLFSECDEADDKICVNQSHLKTPVHHPPTKNGRFLSASGKKVSLSSEALQKAKSLFSDISFAAEIPGNGDRKQNGSEDTDKTHCGFTTAGGEKVRVSQKNLLKANHLLKDFDESLSSQIMKEADAFFTDCDMNNTNGPVSRSGSEMKNFSKLKPDESVSISISDNPGKGCTDEATGKLEKESEDSLPPQRGGFQTASGKGVCISTEALKKAKSLLSESDEVGDKIGTKQSHFKTPVHRPFLSASGKPSVLSPEALEKAKTLFSDVSVITNVPTVSNTTESDKDHKDAQSNMEKMHCGFKTAGGAKVHVSEKSLLKANNLLKELDDGESHGSNSCSVNPPDNRKFDPSKDKTDAFREDNLHDGLEQKTPSVLDGDINQTGSNEGPKVMRADESSVLNFQSLDLTGCTETQQRFLAQEALDCTKALLEDEAEQSLSLTSETGPQQDDLKSRGRSAEEERGRGKRSMEDADMTGEPPLKKRLEEYDRTIVHGPRSSVLHPVKSCPDGVRKDRVFKYSTALQPNITKPLGSGRNFIETRFQDPANKGDSRLAQSKKPAFVPPFIRSANTEANTTLKDNIRTPPAFTPPFKRQRSIVQESSSKPQKKEEDVFVIPYVPPTKKTQGSTDEPVVVDSTSSTSSNVTDNQSLSIGCVSSGAKESNEDDTLSRSQDIHQSLESIELAQDMQAMRLRKKKRQNIRPQPGSLFLTKTSGVERIPLKVAVSGKAPARYTQKQLYEYGVQKHVSDITSETAESFRFSLLKFMKEETFIDRGGVQLADGGWLIPSNDGTAGKEEFYRALCDTPGVDPKLISEAWVYNHYRWIVWKKASMEKSFPETMASLCLTPEQVLLQLKYRYDVEVDHSRRPALRKIMEKDDTSAKTLVLCVAEIISRGQYPNKQSRNETVAPEGTDAKVENPSGVVWLTDGWYAIKAQLDEPLTAMLRKGRLAVGGKLIIHGAQLVGSQDACPPLEAPESLMLKICANSSRPARWDAKLGFHKDPRPFLLPVSSFYSNGGPVGCVDIVVLRSYPIQWMERKPDGGVVFRSVRAEEKEARRYDSHKQKAMEILFAKIQAQFEAEKGNVKPQRRRQMLSHQDIASLQDGEELYEAVGDDPAYLEAHLSEQQLETLHTYRRSLMEKKQTELQDRYRRALEGEDNEKNCPRRDVTPVWRLCVADSTDQDGNVYQLNLWRPSSDLQSLLKEGCRYKVYNLTTSEGKKRSTVESVQLTGTKKTQFLDLQVSQEWLSAHFQPRVSTNFVNLQNPEYQPLCGEVDLTGCVISIVDERGSSPAFFLADADLNFVKVRCFSSLSQAGLEDVLKPRVLLALSNLQLRGQSMHPTPVVYAGDLTVFSTNPKEAHLQESLTQIKNLVQSQENFFLTAEEKLSHLLRPDGLSSVSSPALQPQSPASSTAAVYQKPIRSVGALTPVSRNVPAKTSSAEKDPRSLKRRRALAFLSRVPSPPRLSHLGPVVSPSVKKTFNPPRRSGAPSTLKTAQITPHKPVDSLGEGEWVNDEELAMIDTQALRVGDGK